MPIIFDQIKKNNDYPAKMPAIIFPFQKMIFCRHCVQLFQQNCSEIRRDELQSSMKS